MSEFNLERVKKLVKSNNLLKGAYERNTRRSNQGGEPSYRAIFNALVKGNKGLMELYEQTI